MLQRFYAPELYAPGKKVYEMFKGAGSSGRAKSSFTRKHEARKTAMRSHRYVNAWTCQRGARLRRNTLYPSTILQEMPCGPGKVVHYESTTEEVDTLVSLLRRKMLFGFAEVDLESQGSCGKIRRISAFVLRQSFFTRGDSGAHEKVFGTNQANRITIL